MRLFYLKLTTNKSLPLVGARLLHAATDFINMLIIAQLGVNALAASSLIAITAATILLVAWSILFSIPTAVGYAYGAKQCAEVGKIFKSGLGLALFSGIIASIIMWHANFLLTLFHQPPNLIQLTIPYFRILALGIIPSLICVCFNELVTGILKTHLVVLWRSITTPLTIFLSYGLVLGKFGLPKLGIGGAALGYTITYWGLAIGLIIYFSSAKKYRVYALFKKPWRCSYLKKLFSIGWPISVQLGTIMVAYTMLTYMMGWFGKTALAANQIIAQYATIVAMIPYGISQASCAIVAQTRARDPHAIKIAGFAGIGLSGIIVTLMVVIYWIAPEKLIALYLNLHDIDNSQIIHLAVLFLYLSAFNQITDSLGVGALGALRGLSDTKIPMLINITTCWLTSIPLGYILAFKLGLGAIGLNLGFVVGSALSAILLIKRFKFFKGDTYG